MAWYAWLSATMALCGGAGVLNPGLGVACSIAIGLISFTLVDFNDACKSTSPMMVPAGVRRSGHE